MRKSIATLTLGIIAGAALGCTVSAEAEPTCVDGCVMKIARVEPPTRQVRHAHNVTYAEPTRYGWFVETKNGAAFRVTLD